jgi:O-antigen ligase
MGRIAMKNHRGLSQKIVELGLIGLIIFSPLPAASVHDWSILVIQLTALFLMICFLLTAEKGNPDIQREDTLKWPKYLLLGFWIYVLFQLMPLPKALVKTFSPETYAFLKDYSPDVASQNFMSLSLIPSNTLKAALALMPYFLIGFLTIKTIKTRSQVVRMFSVLFAMGIFEAGYGLLELYSRSSRILFYEKIHDLEFASGTFVNRNHFAGYMEMLIPVSLGLILARGSLLSFPGQKWKEKMRRFKEKKTVVDLLLTLGVIIMSLSLVFSRSRSGIFIMVLIFVLFMALNISSRGKRADRMSGAWIYLVSIFIIIMILSLSIGMGATLKRFSWDRLLQENRTEIWKNTWAIIADFPFFGAGMGTFDALYPVMESDGEIFSVSHAHNDYLEYLSELGVIGTSLLLGGVIFILVVCFLNWQEKKDPLIRGLGLGGIVAVFSLMVHGLTDFNFHIPANLLLFAVLLALTFAVLRLDPVKEKAG